MKKFLLIAIILFSIGALQTINAARVPIIYGNGLTLSTTHQLPDSCTIGNEHVNIGVAYEQFSLFWMPMWNYGDASYIAVNDAENTYWDLDDEMVEEFRKEYDLDIPQKAGIPFWTKVGGKPIALILIALIIYGIIPSKNEEEEMVSEEETKE